MKIAKKNNLNVLEDCAQCYLGYDDKKRISGTIGDAGSWSVESSKHISSNEGVILTTNNKNFSHKMRKFGGLGFTNITAISGKVRIDKIDQQGIFNIESWLIYHGEKLAKRFHFDAYIMMNHLLSSINIEREGNLAKEIIKNIRAEIHLIAVDSDLFFTPAEDKKTFDLIKKAKKNIFYHELNSLHGHDAFLIENENMALILSKIFK